MNNANETVTLEKIVSLCKRRGFVFQGAEIYGGINGIYDFGHLGYLLKNNIKQAWTQAMQQNEKGEIFFLDGSLLGPHAMWEASGHIANFNDPLVDNKDSKKRYRVDQLLESQKETVLKKLTSLLFPTKNPIAKNNDDLILELITELFKKEQESGALLKEAGVQDPHSGAVGSWTNIRQFNLMFATHLGALSDDSSKAYLRPETAQTIFVNFKNIMTTNRAKLPFGVAQIGQAFRNEITPRQFLFRVREFEQMEMEWFCHEKTALQDFQFWLEQRKRFYESLGLDMSKVRFHEHTKDELAHYSVCCTDVQYEFPFGWKELEGIAHRGTFDLTQHSKFSGKDLAVFDQEQNSSFIPTVIETSVGIGRLFLAVLFDAYHEDTIDGETRVLLKLSPKLAPIKAAFFPLVKKFNEPMEKIYQNIQKSIPYVQFDESGSIGKRYRRQDEIGTPLCFTYDFESEKDSSVTVRHRDSGKQERIAINSIQSYISSLLT